MNPVESKLLLPAAYGLSFVVLGCMLGMAGIFYWMPHGNPDGRALIFFFTIAGFLLVGTLAVPWIDRRINLTTIAMSFGVSYAAYALIAVVLRSLGLGYQEFLWLWAALIAGLAAYGHRHLRPGGPSECDIKTLVLCFAAIILTFTYFLYPVNEDQGIFHYNIFSSYALHNFEPSKMDMLAFGVDEVQPRMVANIYHAFFGLLAYVSGTDPNLVVLHLANPYIGFFCFFAMAALVWQGFGQRIDPVFPFVAVILSLLVFWYVDQQYQPLLRNFRFVNGPALDKDFTQFLLIPVAAIFWLRMMDNPRSNRKFFLLFLPALLVSHPLALFYCGAVITLVTLGSCMRLGRSRETAWLAPALCMVASGILWSTIQTGYHDAIDRLIMFDQLHYIRNNYSLTHYKGSAENALRYFEPLGFYYLRSEVFFNSPTMTMSAIAFLIWSVYCLCIQNISRRNLIFYVSGMLSSLGMLALGALGIDSAGMGGFCLIVAIAAFSLLSYLALDKLHPPELAYRLQWLNQMALILVYALVNAALWWKPELFRGLERVHWFYFGYYSMAWLGYCLVSYLRRHTTKTIMTPARVTMYVYVIFLSYAGYGFWVSTAWPPQVVPDESRHFSVRSYLNSKSWPSIKFRSRNRIDTAFGNPSNFDESRLPQWMDKNDRFLYLGSPVVGPFDYWVFKHNVHHGELYSEGYALKRLGDGFLQRVEGYHDLKQGIISCAGLRLLTGQSVSVIITNRKRVIRELNENKLAKTRQVAPDTYRIVSTDAAKNDEWCRQKKRLVYASR